MNNISKNRLFFFLLSLSIFILLVSYGNEFSEKIKPCKLCRLQRLPHIAVIIICIFGYLSSHKEFSIKGLQTCFLLGLFLSLYHIAILYGYLSDPCKVPPQTLNKDSYFSMIEAGFSCSKSSLNILKFPASFWNALICFMNFSLITSKKKQGLKPRLLRNKISHTIL